MRLLRFSKNASVKPNDPYGTPGYHDDHIGGLMSRPKNNRKPLFSFFGDLSAKLRGGSLMFLFKSAAVKPGELYGKPGAGKSWHISIISSVLLILLWFSATNLGWVKPLFLPSPQAVSEMFSRLLTEEYSGGTLIEHTGQSLFRIFTAFFLAAATAIPLGLAMGVNRVMRGVFDPPLEFYRPLPPLAYLPLTILWLGIGEEQKITLIFLAMFAPIAISARAGVRSVSLEQIHAAYSLGATRRQINRHVVLMSALPEVLTGLRIGIGFGWTTLVAAEIAAAEKGLGHMILDASEFLASDIVVMGIILIGLIAFSFDLLMRFVERLLVPWKGRA